MTRFKFAAAAIVVAAMLAGCTDAPSGGAKKECCGTCGGCTGDMKLDKPELFLSFGQECNVPDGMALDADNNIILAVPNYVDKSYPGKLMKITFENGKPKADLWYMLPVHPEIKEVHPMGLEFGPDGNLYIADNQYFVDKNQKSRLLKVIVKDGKPVDCVVAVDRIKLANAVRWKGNECFVSDTFWDIPGKKHQSGIWRFTLEEMNKGTVVLGDDIEKDPHNIAQFTAKYVGKPWDPPGPDDELAGADGMTFDSQGNLYCGNFGDGIVSKMTFGPDGKVTQEVIIEDPSFKCCDGITCDTKTDIIYMTNSQLNAIHTYNIKTKKLCKVWENDDTDGADGLLDQPCEPLLRNGQLIIVNFDHTFPGLKNTKDDKFNTLSVFNLK